MLDVVFDAVRFYTKCARWAARGTVERANVWFWAVGLPLVALAGWYWEIGTLTIPDSAAGFITFMIVTIMVTWVVFFVIRFFGAPPHFNREVEKEVERLSSSPVEVFEFVYDGTDPRFVRQDDQKIDYFVGLHIISRMTVDYPNVRALEGLFTSKIAAQRGLDKHKYGPVQLYAGGALDPDDLEFVFLCSLPPERKYFRIDGPDDPLDSVQEFTLEARGRHAQVLRKEFEYDPNGIPMIRMV